MENEAANCKRVRVGKDEEEGGGEEEVVDVKLLQLNSEASEEFEETASKQQQEEQEALLDRNQVLNKLDALLSQASQYTAFLEDQLIQIHGQSYDDETSSATTTTSTNKAAVDESKLLVQPKTLTGGELKSYQLTGFRWLFGLFENGLNGILADEMGLGKTVQTISLFAQLRELGVFGWRLIVVPLSTLTNWVREIEMWCPTMPVLMYHGTKEERAALRREMHAKRSVERDIPVVVTTYEIVCRDRRELQSFEWTYLVIDEGHRLKNRDCRLIKELNTLVGMRSALEGGCSKLLLTGTPLQNNLAELWSLLHFLLPQVFSSLSFFLSVFQFDDNNSNNANSTSNSATDAESRIVQLEREQNLVSKLHKVLRPFMMRRLKAHVEKHLPPKKELLLYCPMTVNQRALYESIRAGELAALLREAGSSESEPGANTSSSSSSSSGGISREFRKSFMNILMQLRKAANHPFLHFDPTATLRETDASIIEASGKMVVLDSLLGKLKAKGHKVLIFSQFTSMLDIIDDYLRFLRPQYKYCRLDGSTHIAERRDLMTRFNQDDSEYFVFLLSTRAGGVGINLAASDTVIIFDSDWNPHQDSQAQDRAHRIGQKRPVVVYRFVTSESVELKIIARANSKRKLERVVVGSKQPQHQDGGALTADLLREMLTDDFSLTNGDGDIDDDMLVKIMDRDALFKGLLPKRGKGYEIADHSVSSII